jgi:hypothetical protein
MDISGACAPQPSAISHRGVVRKLSDKFNQPFKIFKATTPHLIHNIHPTCPIDLIGVSIRVLLTQTSVNQLK